MQTVVIYADDSALIASGKNVAVIETTLSSELEYVSNWLIDNKLSLHLGKHSRYLTRFNKIAIQGTTQMAVDKEARAYRESTHIVIIIVTCLN